MDGGGRVARSLKRSKHPRVPQSAGFARDRRTAAKSKITCHFGHHSRLARLERGIRRVALTVAAWTPPRGSGVVATGMLLAASLAYGTVTGNHVPVFLEQLSHARDAVANAAGFGIDAVSVTGQKQVSEDEVLQTVGVTPHTSLLFLDVDAARERLMAIPWIAEATVRKLYPDRLQISITEREAFAYWQRDGKISIIAADGTILGAYGDRRVPSPLPLLVGIGADEKGKAFLDLLGRYPAIRSEVQASILVADRRWNLKLKNGIDIRLPEEKTEHALDVLLTLDREKRLLSRDITAVDLRLTDRVVVRLSEEAAKAREEALKKDKSKRKGTDA